MISIIICSRDKKLLEELLLNIEETIGIPYEVLARDNSLNTEGICEAYNLGASKAKYQYLVFCHEDLLFHTQDWGENLIRHLQKEDVSLVGILGNIIKTRIPSGVYSSVQNTNRINQLQRLKDGSTIQYLTNPLNETVSEVKILDGMFLATKKDFWEKHPFDQTTFDGFHGYDIDFSLSMGSLGKVVVVYDILIEHFSFGGNTLQWIESQSAVIKKWRNKLPAVIKGTNEKELKKRAIDDLTQLTLSILKLKWSKFYAFKYSFLLFMKAPFRRVNLFISKKLTLILFE